MNLPIPLILPARHQAWQELILLHAFDHAPQNPDIMANPRHVIRKSCRTDGAFPAGKAATAPARLVIGTLVPAV